MAKDQRSKFIGLDVHKNTITIAMANEGSDGEVRLYGTINNSLNDVDKVIRRLQSEGALLSFVYEAGPCGFVLYRHLKGNGLNCIVAAPSMIPKKTGSRIKNDNRNAITLARLLRAGELTAIYVPELKDDAIRDLTRARNDARIAERKAKQRLHSFYCEMIVFITVKPNGSRHTLAGWQLWYSNTPSSKSFYRSTLMRFMNVHSVLPGFKEQISLKQQKNGAGLLRSRPFRLYEGYLS